IGIVSAASMAAIPPLYGFVAKEAIYTALWYGGGWQRLLLIALIAGSILTVAYSWRFVIGAFGPAPGAPRVETPRIAVLYWLPPAAVAALSIGLVAATDPLERLLRAYSTALPETGQEVHLAVVPHLGVPLLASAVTLGLGIGLSLLARPVAVLQKRLSPQSWADGGLLEALDAERGFRRILRATDAVSIVVTTLFQRGSLPYTLGTMLVVLIALVTPVALTQSPLPDNLVLFHHPLELIVLPVAGLAALGAARSRRRLRAVGPRPLACRSVRARRRRAWPLEAASGAARRGGGAGVGAPRPPAPLVGPAAAHRGRGREGERHRDRGGPGYHIPPFRLAFFL